MLGLAPSASHYSTPEPDSGQDNEFANCEMIIDKKVLDELTAQAKVNPRLRVNLDLRDSAEDDSQRMLNAIEPGTVLPIHRHKATSETCICIRGHFEEYFYDDEGRLTETIDMVPGDSVINIPAGQWHSLRSLESGTVLFEAKNGKYEPLAGDEVLIISPTAD